MKLSGWLFAVALLFAGGGAGFAVGGLIVRGAFQVGVKVGKAPFDSLHVATGGLCERADVPKVSVRGAR